MKTWRNAIQGNTHSGYPGPLTVDDVSAEEFLAVSVRLTRAKVLLEQFWQREQKTCPCPCLLCREAAAFLEDES